ncbi:hypothetical protein [Flexithrix dorotheae]|nr:hypothetical protein [Flexithrix dorotheae]
MSFMFVMAGSVILSDIQNQNQPLEVKASIELPEKVEIRNNINDQVSFNK